MTTPNYPAHSKAVRTVWNATRSIAKFFRVSDATEIYSIDTTNKRLSGPAQANVYRERVPIADVNAGTTLLPAVPGYKYRIHYFAAIAYGGAVGTLTSVELNGTQSSSVVDLASFAQANLTQSTYLGPESTGTTLLADGASFAICDANTAISVSKTGGAGDTATGIDFLLIYSVEAA